MLCVSVVSSCCGIVVSHGWHLDVDRLAPGRTWRRSHPVYQADYTVALNDRAKRIRALPVHGASFPPMASKEVEPTSINPSRRPRPARACPRWQTPTGGAELGPAAAPSSEIQGRPPLSDFDSLQRGIKVYKWFRGPPVGRHIRQLKISADYTSLVWQSKGQERALKLSEVEKLTKGLSSFSKDVKKASELDMSFTVHTTTSKDLEVTAVKSQDFNILFNVIQFLILNPKEAFNLNNGGRKNLTGPFDVFTWGFGGLASLLRVMCATAVPRPASAACPCRSRKGSSKSLVALSTLLCLPRAPTRTTRSSKLCTVLATTVRCV